MKRIISIFTAGCFLLLTGISCDLSTQPASSEKNASANPDLQGRWDITIDEEGIPSPSWLEICLSGYSTYVGQFVSISGSARPVSEIHIDGNQFNFSIPPQWEEGDGDITVEGELADGQLTGTMVTSEGKKHTWKGVKAPLLNLSVTPDWGEPIELFNGKDLSGWVSFGKENKWTVEDGILKTPGDGGNLKSEQTFSDFRLHAEFRYAAGSNSGIYLRGRHEVQIQDDKGKEPSNILFGGVYGFLTPNEMAAGSPGEWQTFDITLIGRRVTIIANGKTIICNQIIPGITGGAIDSNEGEPGPVYLQGDHGSVEFRSLVITPAK